MKRITELENERESYVVLSSSGAEYLVEYQGSGDGDPDWIALWSCNCPAGQWGKKCRHIEWVGNLSSRIADYDPLEEIYESFSSQGCEIVLQPETISMLR